jgi:hypothetical protein
MNEADPCGIQRSTLFDPGLQVCVASADGPVDAPKLLVKCGSGIDYGGSAHQRDLGERLVP